jgi:hypothetical protein
MGLDVKPNRFQLPLEALLEGRSRGLSITHTEAHDENK